MSVLRTELMFWENGPTKTVILCYQENDNTKFFPNSAISFRDRHFLNLFHVIVLSDMASDESGVSGQRIRSLNNYGMNLRQTRMGLDFSEDF